MQNILNIAFVSIAFGICLVQGRGIHELTTAAPVPTPDPTFQCPEGDGDSYHKHPTDCTKYYQCTNKLAWLQQCSAGLYFNPATLQCDWPENVDCENGGGGVTANPAVRGQTVIGPAPWYECPDKNGAYPHESDCDKYYDCYEGSATLGQCTDKMLFDLKYSGCNWAQDVYCDGLTRPTDVPTTTHRTTTTTKVPGGSTETPFECPDDGLFPDPKTCGAYYMCHGGVSWHNVCPYQLYFSIPLSVCDHLINVECGERPIIP